MSQLATFFSRVMRFGGAATDDLPQVAAGERIYAIGDIHGRSDLLKQLLLEIHADMAQHPGVSPRIVFLGDYVDRGPDTRGVLDIMATLIDRNDIVLLSGNHEEFMLTALDNIASLATWLWAGGREALSSYDVRVPMNASDEDLEHARLQALDKVPVEHLKFLRSLKSYYISGDYAFVHAGIRPGIPIDQQTMRDLLWIREEFVSYTGPHQYIVVHGHTPVEQPEVLSNRINIDTGAYITGNLSCLVLEGSELHFL